MDMPTAAQRDVDTDLLKKHPERYPDLSVTQQYCIPYETVMDDCAALVALAAETARAKVFEFRGRACREASGLRYPAPEQADSLASAASAPPASS